MENAAFGGGIAETVVNPVILGLVLLAGVLMLRLPKGRAIAPFLALGILIPTDQIVVLAGLHFPMLRVLALFAFVRMFWAKFSRKEKIFSGGINGIDIAVITLAIFTALDGILLWRVWGEVVYQLGYLWTTFGVYFAVRYLIRCDQDVKRTIRTLAWIAPIVAGLMIYEHITGRNPYYANLGGSQATHYAVVGERDGAFRATGCFAHPLLAGSFGGFLVPLFVAWWWKVPKDRVFAALATVAAMIIPFTTGTSTALFGLLGGVMALLLWPLRRRMRFIRWSIVISLVSLHLVMKAPVWHLISRVHLAEGSSSYHRYELVNQCILHFWDWVLIGTKDYASWGWMMWDLCNQYVRTADTSGLVPLIALIAILVYGFKYLGKTRRYYQGDRRQERFIWALSAVLFANVVAFMGVSYFDQTIVPWYAVLAIISTVTLPARTPQRKAERVSVAAEELELRSAEIQWPDGPRVDVMARGMAERRTAGNLS